MTREWFLLWWSDKNQLAAARFPTKKAATVMAVR